MRARQTSFQQSLPWRGERVKLFRLLRHIGKALDDAGNRTELRELIKVCVVSEVLVQRLKSLAQGDNGRR